MKAKSSDNKRDWSALRRRIRKIWATFGLLAMLALAWSFQAHGVDGSVLETDADVRVTDHDEYLEFVPTSDIDSVQLLFFPGAMVQIKAYAPMARAIARAGFRVVIIKYPLLARYAATDNQKREARARAVRRFGEAGPGVRWVVASHSFGGVIASQLAAEQPGDIRSLVLIGTTHPRDVDLSGSGLSVLKILGTRDGVAPTSRARDNAAMLPPDARWIEIEGGNHSQFAYYGPQLGDGRATITRGEQLRRLVDLLVGELSGS